MSDYMGDISGYLATGAAGAAGSHTVQKKDNASLDMTDFLSLMVAQFQNQSIDNAADPSDMLNQLVQMSMIQAITNITDATVMMYAGSLVGKEVTVGQFDNEGKLQEIVGQVTGTGMSGGQQIIFVDGESYYLSDIMAVGRLPGKDQPGDAEDSEKPEGTEPVPPADGTEVTPPEGSTEGTIPVPPIGTEPEGTVEDSQNTEQNGSDVPVDGTEQQGTTSGDPTADTVQAAEEMAVEQLRLPDISDEIRGRRYVDLLGGPLNRG